MTFLSFSLPLFFLFCGGEGGERESFLEGLGVGEGGVMLGLERGASGV